MKKGDIVLVSFPFTDFSGIKNRPAIILIANNLDVTVAFITTQINWKEETDIILQPNTGNGLKKESLIRLSKLATLDKDLVLGLLGKLDTSTMEYLNNNLKKLLQIV